MAQEDNDKLDIEALYQNASKELPAKDVDKAILSFAKSHLPESSEAPSPKKRSLSRFSKRHLDGGISKSTWRKWQWPMSVAASVLVVAVLFVHYDEVYTNPDMLNDEVARTVEHYRQAPAKPEAKEAEVSDLRKREPPGLGIGTATVDVNDPDKPRSVFETLAPENLNLQETAEEGVAVDADEAELLVQKDVQEKVQEKLEQLDPELLVSGIDDEFLDALLAVINPQTIASSVAKFKVERQVASRAQSQPSVQGATSFAPAPTSVPAPEKESAATALTETEKDYSVMVANMSPEEAKAALVKYLNEWQLQNPDKEIPEQYRVYLEEEN